MKTHSIFLDNMKITKRKTIITIFLAIFLCFSFTNVVFADDIIGVPGGDEVGVPGGDEVGVPGSDSSKVNTFGVSITNPLKGDIDTVSELIAEIIRIIVLIAVPIITLAIIYAGFLFVQARGNSEKLKEARSTLVAVLIGAGIILGAWVIAEAIGGTVDELGQGTGASATGTGNSTFSTN